MLIFNLQLCWETWNVSKLRIKTSRAFQYNCKLKNNLHNIDDNLSGKLDWLSVLQICSEPPSLSRFPKRAQTTLWFLVTIYRQASNKQFVSDYFWISIFSSKIVNHIISTRPFDFVVSSLPIAVCVGEQVSAATAAACLLFFCFPLSVFRCGLIKISASFVRTSCKCSDGWESNS